MWVAFVSLLVGLPLFLFVRQVVLYLNHRCRSYKLGYGVPPYAQWQWLGIPGIVESLKAGGTHELCSKSAEIHGRRPENNKTAAMNSVGGLHIYTEDPENLKAVLSTQFKDFGLGDRQEQLHPLLGRSGIFVLDGDGWQHSRAVLRPSFTKDRVIDQLNLIEPHTERLLDLFRKESARGGTFDVQAIFQNYTLELTLEFLFAEQVDCLSGSRKVLEFQEAFDDAQQFLIFRSFAGIFYRLVDTKAFRANCRICHDFIDELVQRSLEKEKQPPSSSSGPYVFIDALMEETTDKNVLRDQCTSVILAGRDTTAALLSFSCYMLARDQDIFDRLKQTVLEEFGTDRESLTYDSLRQCQYLKNFINEVLRYYATVPFNFRQAVKDTSLPHGARGTNGPIFLSKGTQVMFSSWAIHRSTYLWGSDANEFNPDRWTREACPSEPWAYLPFNGGPRVCIGQMLALSEASYTLVRILQTFDKITTSDSEMAMRFEEDAGFVLKCNRGVNVRFD